MTGIVSPTGSGPAPTPGAPAFHRLRVALVRPLTDDAVEIGFDVPPELADAYAFTHGQHLTLRLGLDGEQLRRSYSITSRPGTGELRIGVRNAPHGVASNWLTSELRAGDELEVMTPAGRFTAPTDSSLAREWLLVAAGSGITPIMSILRTVLAEEPQAHVTVLCCNRSVRSIMFLEELDDLKNEHVDRLAVAHFLTRERRNAGLLDGRITGEKLRALDGTLFDSRRVGHAFVCGPQGMTLDLRATLLDLGLPVERVHVELFGTQTPARRRATAAEVAAADVVANATVVLHGIETQIELREGERVLDAARRHGLDAPFACTGGVCATCRAHLDEGEVQMAANYALDSAEVEAGFVLTCQSEPRSKHLRVDFDRA